ncbi:hypothetical protein HF289_01680 [Acidithiobacillus ferrooxidans]|uniref:hypothetical protein n=1 Tax=Acidithiobacillus ferrooxidans TaxID=920 RepID=UPI001C065062|nr:hypothetical protein [Acidithiobacillus ferrooxidans]MBU2855628.1 hypothetical protein [Acidithiobacillus ferrooxidans]MBU2861738.1 hypothetical protein [Acidithiobacillus ferrooxidans]
MERNAVEKQVAQHYAGGIYAPDRAPTDTAIHGDTLFMFLMGEAGRCEDMEDWMVRIADAVDRIQELMEVLEVSAEEG